MDIDEHSFVETQIDNKLDKLFGDKDNELRILTRAAILEKPTDVIVDKLKKNNEMLSRFVNRELTATLDSHGNIILIEE